MIMGAETARGLEPAGNRVYRSVTHSRSVGSGHRPDARVHSHWHRRIACQQGPSDTSRWMYPIDEGCRRLCGFVRIARRKH